jgi:hypothetical protein
VRSMQPNSGGVVPLPVPALAVLSVTTQTLVQQARLFVHLSQVFVHVPRGLAQSARAYPPLDPVLRAALHLYHDLDPTPESSSLSPLSCSFGNALVTVLASSPSGVSTTSKVTLSPVSRDQGSVPIMS